MNVFIISNLSMKLTKIKVLFFLLILGCQNQNHDQEPGNQIILFDLKELPEITDLKLSDLGFADIEYIPLKTDEPSAISFIMDIKFGKGYFLVQSFNRVLKFSDNGSFMTQIGTEGRGPNEFTHVHDFDIDETNQNIYLLSAWQNKFFIYSENGGFIRSINCPIYTTQFIISKDGIICYSINSFANIEISYNLIDSCGEIIKTYPNNYQWKLVQPGTHVFEHENLFYKLDNRLFKKEISSDTIYEFDHNGFKPYLVIEHGKNLLSPQTRADLSSEYLFENFIVQKSLFEFGEYIFYEFGYKFKIGKNNFNLALIGSRKNNLQALISEEKGIVNDLDAGPNIWPITIKSGKTIIAWIDALKLKTHVTSDTFKNSTPIYPEKKKELEKLANNLKETDNPVLVLVSLKK